MALRKPNGTLRRIATGETMRRLTSKIAVEFVTERARVILEPLQLGVKTPNGCEAIIHTARQWLHRHCSDASKVALSVDISTRSTRFTGRRCCGLFVFIFLHSLLVSTAAIGMIVSSSLAPVWRLLKSFPVRGEFNRATPGPGSLRSRHPLSYCGGPCCHGGHVSGWHRHLLLWMTGSALVLLRRFSTSFLPWSVAFGALGFVVNLDKTEVIPATWR